MNSIQSENQVPYNAGKVDIVAQALSILAGRLREPGEALTSPESVKSYLAMQIAEKEHEVFGCLFLDNQHRVIACENIFRGTIDGASVHPREVVKESLQRNAAAVILYHNHPSGFPEPSEADKRITQRLIEALKLIDVRVLDHIVIGGLDSVSFAERGLI